MRKFDRKAEVRSALFDAMVKRGLLGEISRRTCHAQRSRHHVLYVRQCIALLRRTQ